MTIKNKIKPNEELYGDFADKLIPLNLDAVQQRIDFFKSKIKDCLENKSEYDKFNMYYEAFNFWVCIQKEHCEVEV